MEETTRNQALKTSGNGVNEDSASGMRKVEATTTINSFGMPTNEGEFECHLTVGERIVNY